MILLLFGKKDVDGDVDANAPRGSADQMRVVA
jgi:hypothetical protein